MSGPNLRLVDGRPEPKRFWVDDALIDAKLRYYSKITYCVLARLVRGVAIKISHRDLARLGDLSVSSIQRGLAELEATGWIRKESGRLQEEENTYRLLGAPNQTTQASQSDHPGEGGLVSQTTPRGEGAGQPDHPGWSARPTTTEEATTEETKKRKEHNPAPEGGAAEQAPQAQGLLLVEAEAVKEPHGPARPAGSPIHAAAGNGHDPAVAAPARPGHTAVALFCEAWKVKYGQNPDISGKDAPTLVRLSKKQGLEEYGRRLERYLRDADPFLVKLAHPPAQFENRWNSLGLNGHGPRPAGQAPGLSRAGRESIDEKWEGQPVGAVTL
jgi:hypothetical protein